MGLFDHVRLAEGTYLPEWEYDIHPASVEWQSKSIGHPMMETYRITADGRLLKQFVEYERPDDAEARTIGSGDDAVDFPPPLEAVDDWWEELAEFTRTIEFHATIEGDYVAYEARFLGGQVNRFVRID